MKSLKIPKNLIYDTPYAEAVCSILETERAFGALVFTDQALWSIGTCQPLIEQLESRGIAYRVIQTNVGEPSVDDFIQIMAQANRYDASHVVAVGGGSVMDVAKLCSLMYRVPFDETTLPGQVAEEVKRLSSVMVPTTCGTGAEATCNAILAFPKKELKIGMVSMHMIPDHVVLDPELIRHLPAGVLAATVVDAMAHCVECFTSRKATKLSDLYAMDGAELIFRNAVAAYQDPSDMDAKQSLLLAAYYGGIAITASGTTAVHALSYPLGGKYHIAHGVANAILFAPVMRFNRQACEAKLAKLCLRIHPELADADETTRSYRIIEDIETLVKALKIPNSLKTFGIDESDVDGLVAAAMDVTRLLVNNMREVTAEDARSLYQEIL